MANLKVPATPDSPEDTAKDAPKAGEEKAGDKVIEKRAEDKKPAPKK